MSAIFRVGSIVLRDRLHRPFDRMTAGIFHRCVKGDERRIHTETDGAHKLQSSLWVGWAAQGNFAALTLGKNLKVIRGVVQQIRITDPVLLVLISFGQDPQLVPAIIEPFGTRWRQVVASESRVYKQERVPVEDHLHQAATVLRHKN